MKTPQPDSSSLSLHPDKEIAFHPFADGGVLHRTGSHRLWVLNITAATLWCLMDGRVDADALARDYGARFGIDQATANQDVDALITRFDQWGLLKNKAPRKAHQQKIGTPLEPLVVEKRLEDDISGLPRMIFSLAGHSFAVSIDDDALAKIWQDLFNHLAGADDTYAATELALLKKGRERERPFYLYQDGRAVEAGLAPDEVVPYLIYRIFADSMANLNQRLLFHGAVVARDDQALLLPAPSGAGKSTLSAALCAAGWTYFSDELAVVDPLRLRVEPLALPIGLKDKSMDALAPFWPDIQKRPRHNRIDGIGVRYLAPHNTLRNGAMPIKALVFPRYSTDTSTNSTRLPPLASLERLVATGSSSRPLVSSDIAAILRLAALPSYRLEFSNLEDTLDLLDGLV
jgi:hypothetical protein